METLNDILSSLDMNDVMSAMGIHVREEPQEEAQQADAQEEAPVETLSDDDFNDILSDYSSRAAAESTAGESEGPAGEQDEPQDSESDYQEGEGPADAPQEDDGQEGLHEPEAEPEQKVLLPLNSPTLLMDESTSRFSGTEWYNEIRKTNIILAGLGGIGSHVALNLARMVPASLTLYDDDKVDVTNMSGQLYGWTDVGHRKVDAVASAISTYTSATNIRAIPRMFTSSTEPGDIMICGFDSMEARECFFLSWIGHVHSLPEEQRKHCLFMDGRLSLTVLQVLCITGDDEYNMDRYKDEFLFSSSEAEHTVCSMKQTTYLASMIGAVMVNLFTNFVANTLSPVIPYSLPFFTEYDAQYMIFRKEN